MGCIFAKTKNMNKLHFISVTYQQPTELMMSVSSLLLQTCDDWTLHVINDGQAAGDVKRIMSEFCRDERIRFTQSQQRHNDYGHTNRELGLSMLRGDDKDFVLVTNADNYVCPCLVEEVMGAVGSTEGKTGQQVGIVYFDIIHSHHAWGYHRSHLYEGGIDMMAAAIRLDIAKQVGFPWRHYSADGRYIEQCAKLAVEKDLCAVHIEKALGVHN